jgi:diguanylate cyclase (GGDEF) domain
MDAALPKYGLSTIIIVESVNKQGKKLALVYQNPSEKMKIEIPDELFNRFLEHSRLHMGKDTVAEALKQIIEAELARYEGSASIDTLTGARSRQQLEVDINKETRAARVDDHSRYTNTFVCIDIDDLKSYMDINGLTAGDVLLQEIAAELMGRYGNDNVYRFGADEFVVRAGEREFEPLLNHGDKIKHSIVRVSAARNQRRNHYVNRVIIFHLDKGIVESSPGGNHLTCQVDLNAK